MKEQAKRIAGVGCFSSVYPYGDPSFRFLASTIRVLLVPPRPGPMTFLFRRPVPQPSDLTPLPYFTSPRSPYNTPTPPQLALSLLGLGPVDFMVILHWAEAGNDDRARVYLRARRSNMEAVINGGAERLASTSGDVSGAQIR